jgi:hypothetical protein
VWISIWRHIKKIFCLEGVFPTNSEKHLESSMAYGPAHLTHIVFNSLTNECSGLPGEWQQVLEEEREKTTLFSTVCFCVLDSLDYIQRNFRTRLSTVKITLAGSSPNPRQAMSVG